MMSSSWICLMCYSPASMLGGKHTVDMDANSLLSCHNVVLKSCVWLPSSVRRVPYLR